MDAANDPPRVQAPPVHVAVAAAIRRRIALGTLAPGERLPSERGLAQELGVGRMTVRRAVRLLEDETLVTTRRGRAGGTFVLDDARRSAAPSAITEEMLRDVRENFEFRRGVEPLAAGLAAERASPGERAAIRGLAAGIPASVRAFRTLDSRFHVAIARASGNGLLLEAVSASRVAFFRWADAAWERIEWSSLAPAERDFGERHRAIAEAVAAGDADAAADAMAAHLVDGEAQFDAVIRYRPDA